MNILAESWKTYVTNIRLVLLFSIPFIISFLILLLAPLPAYTTSGGIFIRTGGLFINANLVTIGVIIIASFFSLLFLAFSIVAVSMIVKTEKTHTAIPSKVLHETERYTGRVFIMLLFYLFLVTIASVAGYYLGMQALLTGIVGFFAFLLLFYGMPAVIIDNKRIGIAMRHSVSQIAKQPQYFVLWLFLIIIVVTALDFLFIHLFASIYAEYALLVVNSLLVLPYFVIFETHAYMRRFPILRR